MIRYHGQPYENSDDYANDLMQAEQKRKSDVRHSSGPHYRPLSPPLTIKPVIQVKWLQNPQLILHVMKMARQRTRYRLIADWLNTHYNVDYFTVGKIAGVVYRQRTKS